MADSSMYAHSIRIQEWLRDCFRDRDPLGDLYDAMCYSLMAGGKRLRPMLMLETYRMFGGKSEVIEPFMAAIEMIHTYSLIHDDLPAMDNDDFRRGQPSNHKKFGEGQAILAGDALLNQAFSICIDECKKGRTYINAASEICRNAGAYGMVAGQVVDVLSEGKDINKETLDFIHENKTAAMIIGALKAGAEIGGACEEDIAKIERAGKLIGVAFQIQDDILDVISTFDKLGKPIHSDEKNNKITYASMFGVERASEMVSEMSDEAVEILKSMNANTDFLVKRDS